MSEFLLDVDVLGDCPNIPMDTQGGKVFWTDLVSNGELKVQKNHFTKHCRILDVSERRIAWGSESVMLEKYRRLTQEDFLEPGDIIGVTRSAAMNLYDHYAVYMGDQQVIHYSGPMKDFGKDVSVREASLNEFIENDDGNLFVLFFQDAQHAPKKIYRRSNLFLGESVILNQLIYASGEKFELYSPDVTMARAKSRVGEKAYDLINNNCEHFALWCKTGVSTSFQVREVEVHLAELL